ncbi:hypothetical protein Tco_1046583, partial [Tanacetum coccineum]
VNDAREIITIISDSSSDNNSSNSDNKSSDSASTSQISTSKEIVYSSSECKSSKGSPKSLLKWYKYLSNKYKENDRFWGSKSGGNESNEKPSFSDISKAKACILAKAQASKASSKAKVQAYGSKAKVQTSGSKSKLQTFGLKAKVQTSGSKAKVQTSGSKAKIQASMAKASGSKAQASLKTLIVKSPSEDTPNYDLRKREEREENDYSSDNSDDRKGPSIASVPKERPSIQGLLDWYGYDTIDEYLEETYFPSTYKDITDKDSTDEDTIHESYYPISKGIVFGFSICVLIPFAVCDVIEVFRLCVNCMFHLHLAITAWSLELGAWSLELASCIFILQFVAFKLQMEDEDEDEIKSVKLYISQKFQRGFIVPILCHDGFTLSLLDVLFSKGLRTVKSIPPMCQLGFSRVLKGALNKVICKPDDIACWVSLLVLPLCLLKTFSPRSNLECKFTKKCRRQEERITNAIRSWGMPGGSL